MWRHYSAFEKASQETQVSDSRRPNILIAAFDALSATSLNEHLTDLPTLAGLYGASSVYEYAYSPNPESGPARSSLFTGLDPCVHGVWTDGVALPACEQTLPQRLARGGYNTWLFGRRQLSGLSHWTTEPLRPDEYSHSEWAHGPLHRSRQNAYLNWLQQVAGEAYDTIFPLQANPDDTAIPPEQYQAMADLDNELSFNHWTGQRIGQTITNALDDEPFLCIAGFVVGESMGAKPPQDYCGEALNLRSLQQADNALSHITACLPAAGRDRDTVIVVTAARGNASGNDSEPALTDNQIRVPLFVRLPTGDRAATAAPVSTIDLAPTLLELAQLPLPPRLQGNSLLADALPRGWALSRQRSERHGWHSALLIENWKLVVSHGSPQTDNPPSYRLYNVAVDPHEKNNLASKEQHAEQLEDMIDKLIDARCALEDRTEPRIAKF